MNMRRIVLIIAYDGTNYVGWQKQKNGVSIQQLIENAIYGITGEIVSVQGSGRTDSGVHARAQVAHFDTHARMPSDKFAFALNTFLPNDIRILYSAEKTMDFHARFSAKEKEYCYKVFLSPHEDVFTSRYSLHLHGRLDLERMQKAASKLVGEHDFSAFKSSGTTVESAIRTINKSEWIVNGARLEYHVVGNGFLYNTVRIFVGTMLEIGKAQMPVNAIDKALISLSRLDAGPTAPAHGLTLWRVTYKDFDTEEYLPNDK